MQWLGKLGHVVWRQYRMDIIFFQKEDYIIEIHLWSRVPLVWFSQMFRLFFFIWQNNFIFGIAIVRETIWKFESWKALLSFTSKIKCVGRNRWFKVTLNIPIMLLLSDDLAIEADFEFCFGFVTFIAGMYFSDVWSKFIMRYGNSKVFNIWDNTVQKKYFYHCTKNEVFH